jgi:hypothetical protein
MRAPVLAFLPVVAAVSAAVLTAADYEGPRTFESRAVLPAGLVQNPLFTVGPQAPTDGYFHDFTITSEYGDFEAEGRTVVALRAREIRALAELDKVSKSEVFLKAAGTSVVNVGKGVANVVTDPAGTAKGLGEGVKRFGVNLGRRAKRAEESVADGAKSDGQTGEPAKSTADKAGEAGETVAYSVLGVSSAMRRWAQKVGADPYTTNAALRKALEDIGRVDAAGGIAAKVVIPIPGLVGTTATVGDLVWGKDPEALRKMNEERLSALGVTKEKANAFFRNKVFTLTAQTAFIDALFAVKPKHAADYVETATEADSERAVLFFVESAQMLQTFAKSAPVAAVLPDSRALVAATRDGRAVVLVPVDWIRWTQAYETAAREVASRAKVELGAKRLDLKTSGRMSEIAKKNTAALGFGIEEGVDPGARALSACAGGPGSRAAAIRHAGRVAAPPAGPHLVH